MLVQGFPLDISVVEESAYPGAVAYACITKLYSNPLLFSLYKIVPGAESLSCHLYCTTPNATIHWTVTFSKGNPNERQWSGSCSNGGYISGVTSSYYPLTITAYATAPGYTQSNSVTRTTSPY